MKRFVSFFSKYWFSFLSCRLTFGLSALSYVSNIKAKLFWIWIIDLLW
jgi:hypothetical protein